MPAQTLVVIPLDDRSVNYECPALLGAAAGLKVLRPPRAWLGTPWRAGQTAPLGAWLAEVAPQADALLVAIDTLGYGGLVNSRRSGDSLDMVLARLDLLRQVKQARPETTLLAFNVLMRINRGNDAEEEKPYWAAYGAQLFRLSYLEDRANMAVATPAEAQELAELRPQLPRAILDDYLGGRARNHAVNCRMVDWAAEGIFDYLIVPQDDTMAYGWNIAEARTLRRHVIAAGLADRVSVYPGTDETGMLLLARYAAQRAGFRPTVWLRYSGAGADQVITAYEDRPMTELVKAHLGPLGGMLASSPAEADLLLYVNAPAEVQGNGPEQYVLALTEAELSALPETTRQEVLDYRRQPHVASTLCEMHTVRRNLPEFVRSLAAAVDAGRTCAVVDVAYVNAGDLALGDLLVRMEKLAQLASYGGWNTAGNTLGSVLAHAVIRAVQRREGASAEALAAHIRFLFLRLVEDSLFMARLRTQLMWEALPMLGLVPTLGHLGDQAETVRRMVEEQLGAAAALLSQQRFAGQQVTAGKTSLTIGGLALADVELPWGRLFDLTMDVRIEGERNS